MFPTPEMHPPPREIHFPYGQWRNFDSESSSNVTGVVASRSRRNNQNCFRGGEKRSASPKRILVLSGNEYFRGDPRFVRSTRNSIVHPSHSSPSSLPFSPFFSPSLLAFAAFFVVNTMEGIDGYENPPSFNERLDTRRVDTGVENRGKKIVTEIICRSHRFSSKTNLTSSSCSTPLNNSPEFTRGNRGPPFAPILVLSKRIGIKVLIEGGRREIGGWRHAIPQKGNHRCASENQGQRGIKHPPRGI